MSNAVIVHIGRTNTISVDLGIDITGDTITSEIRTEPRSDSVLIMTWTVTNRVDADGTFDLTVDDTITGQIAVAGGYMDIKRVTGGEPIPVFDKPLEVEFRGTVTA